MALDGLDAAGDRAHEAFVAAVLECAEDLKRESQQRVPVDQWDLHNSAKVSSDVGPAEVQAAVSYDTLYAARQHEEHDWQHDAGRTSDYLGGPLRTNSQRYQQHIANKVRDALG